LVNTKSKSCSSKKINFADGVPKYAYMCHFYANPLSALAMDSEPIDKGMLQEEHLTAVRTLASFKAHVEAAVDAKQLGHAQSLIQDDEYLTGQILEQGQKNKDYVMNLLRSLHLVNAIGAPTGSFMDQYATALAGGVDLQNQKSGIVSFVERLSADDLTTVLRRLLDAVKNGDSALMLTGWEAESEGMAEALEGILHGVEELKTQSKTAGTPLKSKYSAHSRVLRTTVVAQKVQLSRDSAALTAEDKAFTALVDKLTELLISTIFAEGVDSVFLHETFVYDAKSPSRDVFVPRPGTTLERALSRPHDYLACSCCTQATEDGSNVSSTSPATAILYHLYQEAGALINVADLWSAYYALVGGETEATSGVGERAALVHFYRGLAELRAMGFMKQSRKKTDHVAKVKWL
jgi:origin recognition complex subunit 3